MATELTCKELVELVTDYFEKKLPASDLQRFESHLVRCKGCQTYLDQMRQALQVSGTLHEENIAPKAEQELLQVFRNWKTRSDDSPEL